MSKATPPASGEVASQGNEESAFEKHLWEIVGIAATALIAILALTYGPIPSLVALVAGILVIAGIRLRRAGVVKRDVAAHQKELDLLREDLKQQLAAIPAQREF